MARYSRNLCLLIFAIVLTPPFSARSANLESSPTDITEVEGAIASDQSPANKRDAEEVAREVLRLQEEMGGSIVTDFALPERRSPKVPTYVPDPSRMDPPKTLSHPQHSWEPQLPSPVAALRQTAWQLEQSAHLLESLDLYSQADALRTTATRLRQDARRMKSEKSHEDSAAAE